MKITGFKAVQQDDLLQICHKVFDVLSCTVLTRYFGFCSYLINGTNRKQNSVRSRIANI